ncbi:hypothetical protein CsSME_00008385 [Camellia sinensis var. sinensis]
MTTFPSGNRTMGIVQSQQPTPFLATILLQKIGLGFGRINVLQKGGCALGQPGPASIAGVFRNHLGDWLLLGRKWSVQLHRVYQEANFVTNGLAKQALSSLLSSLVLYPHSYFVLPMVLLTNMGWLPT